MRPPSASGLETATRRPAAQCTIQRIALSVAAFVCCGASVALPPSIGETLYKATLKAPDATAVKQDPAKSFKLIRADMMDQDGDHVSLRGNCHFSFKGFEVKCEAAEGNLKTERFRLRGAISVHGDGLNYEGSDVTVNFKGKTLDFSGSKAQLGPKHLSEKLTGDLYLKVGGGGGNERQYKLFDSDATTCSLDDPHWSLSAKSIDIQAERSITLRNSELKIQGKRILSVPYLRLPLDKDLPKYLPVTGQSPDEGYYVKSRFGLDNKGNDLLDGRLDLMTRKGIGVGGDYDYRNLKNSGKATLYSVFGPSTTTTATLIHQQQLAKTTRFDANLNYSKANYLTSPETTTLGTRSNLQWSGGRLSFQRSATDTRSFHSESQTLNLSLQPRIGRWNTTGDFNLASSISRSTGFSQSRRVLDVRLRTSGPLGPASAELLYNRSIPIGTVSQFFSPSDQTPMFTLTSDTRRMMKWGLALPISASIGEWVDPIRKGPITRTLFETSLPSQRMKSGRLDLGLGGRFRQTLYSDDTAQFVGSYDSQLTYNFGAKSSVNVRYGYLRAQGYSPLSQDRSGRSDALMTDVRTGFGKNLSFSLNSGYDFLDRPGKRTPWQMLGFRAEWTPSNETYARVFASYDTFGQVWSNIRGEFRLNAGGARLGGSVRFDGQRHTWGQATLLAEGLSWGKLSTSMLLSFNGYSGRFESRQFSFTYDLHCADAVLTVTDQQTGFRNGTSVGFFVRLKALPFGSDFGGGTRGQGFGGGGFGF